MFTAAATSRTPPTTGSPGWASRRVGLLPRWLLAVWPVVWVIGSFAAVGCTPVLLTGFYVATATVLGRRLDGTA